MSGKDNLANRSSYLLYILMALVIAIIIYVRVRLLAVPLERDEGEFAYIGQLLLKGIPPFSYAYTMKLPGVSVMYALFMGLFGQTSAGIHAGLLIVNATCIFLLYQLTKRLYDRNTALISSVSYALLSLSSSVNGLFAHATHFVVLFALSGFLLLLHFTDNRRFLLLFISGLCFGLAITMKQHALLLSFFAVLYLGWCAWRKPITGRRVRLAGYSLLLLGMILPYALIVVWMLVAGNLPQFWFWTVQYANAYTSIPSLGAGWDNFSYSFGTVAQYQLPFWILAGLGLVLLCTRRNWCADRPFLLGFILFSFLSICPGLIFRGHYFVLLLPAVAIMAGACMGAAGQFMSSSGSTRLAPVIPPLLIAAAVSFSLFRESDNFFINTPLEVSRSVYGANPFPEALQIAAYIREHSTPDARIAVLGSEPEIYFYADRLSATGHIYMYGLMEHQPYADRMQDQLIREIEMERPQYVVVVNIATSWLWRKASLRAVFDWGERYVRDQYDQVGVVDILGPATTRYLWDDKAANYTPVTQTFVTVFKRKSGI